MKKLALLLLVVSLFSCQKKVDKSEENIMVKQSEMAALMLQMYNVNLTNKQKVLKGELPKKFPKEFLTIHTATLTDPSDRNTAFKAYSNFYLQRMQALYNTTNKDSLILKHNNVVNSCITCHETTCVGPIPKIKKLLIH